MGPKATTKAQLPRRNGTSSQGFKASGTGFVINAAVLASLARQMSDKLNELLHRIGPSNTAVSVLLALELASSSLINPGPAGARHLPPTMVDCTSEGSRRSRL